MDFAGLRSLRERFRLMVEPLGQRSNHFELCPKNKTRGGDKNTMDFAGLRSLRERFRLMVEPQG